MNKHVTFNKGQCIGHMEPSIDNMPQTSVKSIITQKMMDKQVQLNIFKSPLHNLSQELNSHSINYWKHSNPNLHEMRQVLAQLT